jgi:PAS domain S-box-containing protein
MGEQSGVAYEVMGASNEGAEWMRLFWLVFERTSNPIVLLDGQRRIEDLNGAALALFGVEHKDELVGKVIDESIRPEEREQAVRDWEASAHSGEYTGKRVLLRADGTEVPVDFAARLADIGARRLTIYVVAAHDPTYKPSAKLVDNLPLRSREREVVTLIALGLDTDEIAERLYISPSTVRTHVRNAMGRLGAHTRAQLVAKVLCAEKAMHPAHLAE